MVRQINGYDRWYRNGGVNVLIPTSKDVIEWITNDVQKSKYFSVLTDETKDRSKTKQLLVMVRYFYNNIVNKRVLGYVSCSELNANLNSLRQV